MKKVVSLALILGLGTSQAFVAAETAGADPDPAEARYQKAVQESERNRELLEIWKDHVRTLTQERDDAYRQIETLRKGAPASPIAAHKVAVETQPLPLAAPSPAQEATIRQLKGRLASLQTDYQSAIKLRDELSALQIERDKLLSEKNAAVRQADELRRQLSRPAPPQSSVAQRPLQENPTGESAELNQARVEAKNGASTAADTQALQTRVSSLESQLASVGTEKRKLQARVSELQSQISGFEKDKADLRAKNEEKMAVKNRDESHGHPASTAQTGQTTRTGIESQVSKLTAENADLRSKIAQSELRVAASAQREKELSDRLSQSETRTSELEMRLGRRVAENSDIADRASKAQTTVDDLTARLKTAETQLETLRSKNLLIPQLEERAARAQKLESDLTAQTRRAAELGAALEEERRQSADRLDKLQSENASLEEKLASSVTRASHEEIAAQLVGVRTQLAESLERNRRDREEIDALRGKVAFQESELASGRKRLEELKNESSAVSGNLSVLQTQLEQARGQAGELNVSKTALEKRVKELTSGIDQIRSELTSETERGGKLNSELAALRSEKQKVDEAYARLENSRQLEDTTKDMLQKKIDALQSQIELMRTENERAKLIEKEFTTVESAKNRLQQSLEELKAQSLDQSEKLKQSEASIAEFRRQIETLHAESAALRLRGADADRVAADRDRIASEKRAVDEKSSFFEEELSKAQSERDVLRKNSERLSGQVQELNARLQTLQGQKTDLASQLSQARSELDVMKAETERIQLVEDELAQVLTERDELKRSLAESQRQLAEQQTRLKDNSAKIDTLKKLLIN